MTSRLRAHLSGALAQLRRDGRPAVLWSLRMAAVATLSYLVGTVFFPGTQPLTAPLTAMLVVQVTPVSLLASGLDRVVAVVAGVVLAVGFAAVVPLAWWSLGLLILVSLTIGQALRLRSNLVEVAISAMLVLGVGSLGAESAAWARLTVTLVGAAVGVLANLVFPPRITTSDAGDAIDGLADSVAALLVRVADGLDALADGPPEERGRLHGSARDWLGEARRITHEIPSVGAALLRAEEGRRLNVRAVGRPRVEPGLRQGLEALEHSAMAIRGFVRAIGEAAEGDWLELAESAPVLSGLADTCRRMAAAVDAFGELVRVEADVRAEAASPDVERLRTSHRQLHEARDRIEAALEAGPPPEVAELHAVERSTTQRLLRELDLDERLRRQLRLLPPRRRPPHPPVRRRPPLPYVAGPDDETRVMPLTPDEDR